MYEIIVLSTFTYRQNNDPNNEKVKSSGGKKYLHLRIIKPILAANGLLGNIEPPTHTTLTPKRQRIKPEGTPLSQELSATDDDDLIKFTRAADGDDLIKFTPKKVGSGLRKIVTNAPVEYVYWNSFDELLERLFIVYGEIKSGNNNPNLVNELVNILQEIREI